MDAEPETLEDLISRSKLDRIPSIAELDAMLRALESQTPTQALA